MCCPRSGSISSCRWDCVVEVPREDGGIRGRGYGVVILRGDVKGEVYEGPGGRLQERNKRNPVCLLSVCEVVVEIVCSGTVVS
jgi:hypothetical protein